jgi:hypothetical protein
MSLEERRIDRERQKELRRARVAKRREFQATAAGVALESYRQDQVRAQIGVSGLVVRLEKCANGKLKMTKEQIACARVLLAKTLPDLQRVEVSGRDGEPIEFRDVNTLSDQDLLAIATRGGEGNPAETPGPGELN